MSPLPISVTIITLNEERNISRCIQSVRGWVNEIIVVDSGSTDHTCTLAKNLGAKVFENAFQGYGQQKNYAQSLTQNDWVLNLDADECVSPELALEIQSLFSAGIPASSGYQIPRLSYYLGRWIKHGGWYPNRLVRLYNKKVSSWSEPEVHEACHVKGPVSVLNRDILHWPFSDIREQIETNMRFSKLGANALIQKGGKPSLLKLIIKPVGKFIETYFIKRGFKDGLPGFIISINAAHSMFLKYATLFELKYSHQIQMKDVP